MIDDAPSPPSDDGFVPVPIPSLVTILVELENRKGAELTEQEVLSVRDKAAVMRMPPEFARRMEQARGYADVDMTDIWKSWRRFRHSRGHE